MLSEEALLAGAQTPKLAAGRQRDIPLGSAPVAFALDGGNRFLAALDDGRLRCGTIAAPDELQDVASHDGLALVVIALPGGGFLSGGEDGRAILVAPDGAVTDLVPPGRHWIGAAAASPDGKFIAIAAGKRLLLFDRGGKALGEAPPAPSTITGLVFNPKGKRIAASHYGGVTLRWAGGLAGSPLVLPWKGSHLGVTWSPDGRFVVSATQERELHGWRLEDMQDLKMTGYGAKVRALSWTADGRWLACSGGAAATLWDFAGKGPWGRPPHQFGETDGTLVAGVAAHPRLPVIAAAFEDGRVTMGRSDNEGEAPVAELGQAPAGLAWSADGATLLCPTEDGTLSLFDLRELGTVPPPGAAARRRPR